MATVKFLFRLLATFTALVALPMACTFPGLSFTDNESLAREVAAYSPLIPAIEAAMAVSSSDDATSRSLNPAHPAINNQSPAAIYQATVAAGSAGRYPASGTMADMWGIPGLRTWIVIAPAATGWYRVNQFTQSDLDYALDYIEYQYSVQESDTSWKIHSQNNTSLNSGFRYALWQENYRDGTIINREISGTSTDAGGSYWALGPLPRPADNLASYRFTGELADLLDPATGAGISYSLKADIVRKKPDSLLDPGRGVEWYSDYSASGGTITSRSAAYLIERQGRSQKSDYIRTVVQGESLRNASTLAVVRSRSVTLSELQGASPETRVIDTIVEPGGSTWYESINAFWSVAATSADMSSNYTQAPWLQIIRLNPQGDGYSGSLWQKQAGQWQEASVQVNAGVLTVGGYGNSTSPAVSTRNLGNSIVLSQIDTLSLAHPAANGGVLAGRYTSGSLYGTYYRAGQSAWVEIGPMGIAVESGGTATFHTWSSLE